MKIRNSSIKTGCFLLLLGVVLLLLPMQAFADDPLLVISLLLNVFLIARELLHNKKRRKR